MEIHHFSHDHPLILSEEIYNTNFPCGVCGEPIFGLSYACQICPYILHKWCSGLPLELRSHKHHLPDHPLILTPQRPSESSTLENCKICKNEIQFPGSAYTCIAKECCSFSLHVECASLLEMITFAFPNIYGNASTSTIYFMRKYEEDCKCVICGYNCYGPLFFTLDLRNTRYLHVQCAMLPHKVKHKRHLHDHRPPLDEKGKYFEFFCDVCEQERNPDDHVYYCKPCELVAHIACGVTGTERPLHDTLGTCPVYELPEPVKQEVELSKLMEHNEDTEEEGEEGEEVEDADKDIKYFGHEHALVLFNYKRPIDKYCQGCFSSVFGKTYSCKASDLHLHQWCAQLPEVFQHSMHPEHGSLKLCPYPGKLSKDGIEHKSNLFSWTSFPIIKVLSHDHVDDNLFSANDEEVDYDEEHDYNMDYNNTANDEEVDYDEEHDYHMDYKNMDSRHSCAVCFKPIGLWSIGSGFFYECEECNFAMHGICAMLPNSLNHQSHKHPLCLYKQDKEVGPSIKPVCQACKFPCGKFVSVNCESCDFHLHVQCFVLPYTGKHIAHRHNLDLTYSYKEDPRALEYFCDLCEKPRIPDRWVYCCPDPDCVIVGHMDCVVPNPFAISQIQSEKPS